MEATRFAFELDKALTANEPLKSYLSEVISEILARRKIDRGALLLFGGRCATDEARLLHGLLVSVLARFANCWEHIYDPTVREALQKVPVEQVNFDGLFSKRFGDKQVERSVRRLIELRSAYWKYMGASAEVLDRVFPKGRVWSGFTVPGWVSSVLQPFQLPATGQAGAAG